MIERFNAHVDKSAGPDACWPWTGPTYGGRYGQTSFRGKMVGAHRAAVYVATGEWPTLHVLHHCDNPPCCNPAHLFQGTQADNNADKTAKGRGRGAVGMKSPFAKLTDEGVVEMRRLHSEGWDTIQLGKKYSVAQGTAWRVVNHQAWTHLP